MAFHGPCKLLGREADPVFGPEARSLVEGRPVLVTGAGGSIGSEIVWQLQNLGAGKIICVDCDEYSLYRLQLALTGQALLTDDTMVLADVSSWPQLEAVFHAWRPQLVFHAAARKQLPLLERNPAQAVVTNVTGTANVAALCAQYDVQRLVNISTDKAATPVSVLGMTKRLAEIIISGQPGDRAASVRFGNVFASRGSFVETLHHQIEAGLPVTITDEAMTRYFMTIPEAAGLVIEAAVLADGQSTYVLDMGTPYRILSIVRRYAQLAGVREPDIIFTGRRPGEKLAEELADARETVGPTRHPAISAMRMAGGRVVSRAAIDAVCAAAVDGEPPAALRAILTGLVGSGQLTGAAAGR
jgi:FlaA1/EpsC-like NDP-sugar epimerase